MRYRFLFMLCIFCSIFNSSWYSFASQHINKDIRVALYYGESAKDKYQWKTSSATIKQDQKELMVLPPGQYGVSLQNQFVYANTSFTTREDAAKVAQALENQGFAYYSSGKWYPVLPKTSRSYKTVDASLWHPLTALILEKDALPLVGFDPKEGLEIVDLENALFLEGKPYRGKLIIQWDNHHLLAINKLSMEEYLYGVLPKEMPPSWNMEALKAQAIVSRTFALKKMEEAIGKPYDICNTTSCQVYDGKSAEKEASNSAVDKTAGLALFKDAKLLEVYFSASNGGWINSSEIAWGKATDHLKTAEDTYSYGSTYHWSFVVNSKEIQQLLSEQGNAIGTLLFIQLNKDSISGRVTEIIFCGSSKTVSIKGEKIRQLFGVNRLKSTLFHIAPGNSPSKDRETDINDVHFGSEKSLLSMDSINQNLSAVFRDLDSFLKERVSGKGGGFSTSEKVTGETYTIYGKGYGHGVGMSQYGAKNRADAGENCQDILSFYFPGSVVQPVYR